MLINSIGFVPGYFDSIVYVCYHSGKFGTVRESNQALGVRPGCTKGALRAVLCTKNSILLAGAGIRKLSYVACGFSPIKILCSDYPKSK